MPIVLASASRVRRALLEAAGSIFSSIPLPWTKRR